MNIQTYAKLKCQDILYRAKERKSFDDFGDFPYDEIVEAEDGSKVKVVNTQSGSIPIMDILGLDREDFAYHYPTEEMLDAYDRYVSMFEIVEGAEVLHRVRTAIAEAQQRLNDYDIDLPV